ncbi:hypothetical protein DPMN_037994 [Dreissena polymorpha]|uniref:Uncharacterized protein n=1 Tax=Dreissena polymorpha TaxID=45954 RepID=A0A9D4RMT1_DREPO|nr:hypothetical protein DPMN_037994 [Dreissena polymorpha]
MPNRRQHLLQGNVIQLTGTIFELNSHIKETNVLTKFHENWAKNITSRVFKCFHYIHIEKNAPPTGGHVFHRSGPFSNSSEISIKPMFFTNFHDDLANIVTSRVFTWFLYSQIRKTSPPTGGHIGHNIFELDRDFIKTKLLTKFHEDRIINVASRVFTNQMWTTDGQRPVTKAHLSNQETKVLAKFHKDWTKNVTSRVFTYKCPAHWRSFFSPIWTIFELNQHITKTNILTNFELDLDFIGTKLLTKFHEDRK